MSYDRAFGWLKLLFHRFLRKGLVGNTEVNPSQSVPAGSSSLTPGRTYFVVSGDSIGPRQLAANFATPPLRIFEVEGTFLLDADSLQCSPGDFSEAESLLLSMYGAMRAAGHPIKLGLNIGGSWMQEPNGGPLRKSGVARASMNFGGFVNAAATALVDGVPQPQPRSLAARIVDWLPSACDISRDLHRMMIKGEPDWRDIHLIIELLQELGYPKEKGVQKQVDRIRHTAGNWHVTGVDARHSRPKSTKPPTDPPTLNEAREFIIELVRQWFDENAPK